MTNLTLFFPKLRISTIFGKQFLRVLYATLGSSVSVSDPESDDILKISIFERFTLSGIKSLKFTSGSELEDIFEISIIGDRFCGILFSSGIKSLKFTSGSESEDIFKVSIIGGRYSEILFSVNIDLGSGFFDSEFSGSGMVKALFQPYGQILKLIFLSFPTIVRKNLKIRYRF